MNVDIYLTDRSGKREIRFPILPEEIKCQAGSAIFVTYEIMSRGEVAVPSGVELSGYSWTSEFPGKHRTDKSIMRGEWKDPATHHNTIKDWLKNGTRLTLLVTGYPINSDVYIESYEANASGAFGDMVYEISLKSMGDITVQTTQTTTKRVAAKTTTYTIKRGDTLWGISKRFLGKGSKWQTIYNANKTIIEQTARKYGKSSSNNGWWIYPGVTLTIPQ